MTLLRKAGRSRHWLGLALLSLGQTLILFHQPPLSDYYFPVIWFGYILTVDGLLGHFGYVPVSASRAFFLLLAPISILFWWLFEAFDLVVRSWVYVGGAEFVGVSHIVYASVCFSTVILAIWESALGVDALITRSGKKRLPSHNESEYTQPLGAILLKVIDADSRRPVRPSHRRLTEAVMQTSLVLGVLSISLPLLYPHYAFGLMWISLFFIADPVNYWQGRSSLLAEAVDGAFRIPLAFASGALVCGFFWEFWNYWATIKWVYHVPFVSQWRLFEMPIPGYLGYLPFGLEAYAVTMLVTAPVLGRIGHRVSRRVEGKYSVTATEAAS